MVLHPLAAGFADVAEAYDRGRPDYAPAAVGALCAELGIGRGDRVLDLAAGTGKLSRALSAAGLEVLAVEPQAALRELIAARTPDVRVIDGTAEQIPLEDGAVSAVTVADAFHWFDREAALHEIRRVLRPGGGLAILTSSPDWGGAPWAHEVGSALHGLRGAHPAFDGPPWQDAVRAAGGWREPREVRVTCTQPTDPSRVVDYVASFSWIATMPERERSKTLARIAELVGDGAGFDTCPVHTLIGLTGPS